MWLWFNTTDAAISFIKARAANTCADPTIVTTFVQAFDAGRTTHLLGPRWVFVNADKPTTGAGEWVIQGAIFRAWQAQQDFTVPMYTFFNPTTTDYVSVISTDGNPPPVPSGFTQPQGIRAYVYPTQVCGSVPLFALFQQSAGDHWYTTDTDERSSLISLGWSDAGTLAYVLPLGMFTSLWRFRVHAKVQWLDCGCSTWEHSNNDTSTPPFELFCYLFDC